MARRHSIGIVGARGYVGSELVALAANHPQLELAFVASRELEGMPVPAYRGELRYTSPSAEEVADSGVDVVVLALPNGKSAPYVQALDRRGPGTLVVDLSADHRFDDDWFYGLPELYRARYRGQRRISNPGCYATSMQLAIAPMLPLLAGPTQCFGVSGYSGAGTKPSDKNDPEKLRDNLIPYTLVGHVHEREVSIQLGHAVEFMPHVAPHFRGITMTVCMHLREPQQLESVSARYHAHYAGEPLIDVVDEVPWVSAIAGRHDAEVGGFALADGGRRLVVVATLDNLLKGAATQALQNVNLALGLPEITGIPR